MNGRFLHYFTKRRSEVTKYVQVSFGVHKTEQDAARQYDRALIIVKGRLAKTNFPMADYEQEVEVYEAYILERCAQHACFCAVYEEESCNMGTDRNRCPFLGDKQWHFATQSCACITPLIYTCCWLTGYIMHVKCDRYCVPQSKLRDLRS